MNEFGIIAAIVIIVALFLLARNIISDFLLINSWKQIQGTITNATVEKYYDDSFEYYSTTIEYTYKLDGKTNTAKGTLYNLQDKETAQLVADKYKKSKTLLVFVNPSNYKDSKIELELHMPDEVTFGILALVLLILIFIVAAFTGVI